MPLQIDILTIFPRMLDGILGESMIKRAQEAGLVRIRCVNLRDYAVGADRGGQTTMFDDFDIDYNQYKYLLELRMSGALTMVKSAMVIVK